MQAGIAVRQDAVVPAVQTPHEIDELLSPLIGRSISRLQVLAPNALKTVLPDPGTLTGALVIATICAGRVIKISTTSCALVINLERTGRVDWTKTADAWGPVSGTPQPTARLLFDDRPGLNFIEPAKTKRITISLLARSP